MILTSASLRSWPFRIFDWGEGRSDRFGSSYNWGRASFVPITVNSAKMAIQPSLSGTSLVRLLASHHSPKNVVLWPQRGLFKRPKIEFGIDALAVVQLHPYFKCDCISSFQDRRIESRFVRKAARTKNQAAAPHRTLAPTECMNREQYAAKTYRWPSRMNQEPSMARKTD